NSRSLAGVAEELVVEVSSQEAKMSKKQRVLPVIEKNLFIELCFWLKLCYAFLRNSVRSTTFILLTLQSTSSSSSVKRIFLITVPFFIVNDDPFTFRLFITTTESPSFKGLPLQSLTSIKRAYY